jgi:hypothetical protein
MTRQNLDDLLGAISVSEIDEYALRYARENDLPDLAAVAGWWLVEDEHDNIAFFAREADAFAYRLHLINLRLNGEAVLARYKEKEA